jgi:hypothetical protein
MLNFNASEFYRAITALKHIETMLRERGLDKHLEQSDGSVVIEFQDDPIVIGFLREQLDVLQKSLQTLGARQTLKSVDRLLKTVNKGEATGPSLVSSFGEIDSRLKDELSDTMLLTLGPKEQDLFEPKEPLFGKEFESKFSSALFELD